MTGKRSAAHGGARSLLLMAVIALAAGGISTVGVAALAAEDITSTENVTRVVLDGVGEIRGPQPGTAVLFEPGDSKPQPSNILQIRAEDPTARIAFHLHIPFEGETLGKRYSIPGSVTDPSNRRQRIELGYQTGEERYLASRAELTIILDEGHLRGTIEDASMVPVPGRDGDQVPLTGHFETRLNVTCWSRVPPNEAAGSLPFASGQLPYRLDLQRTSPYCATAQLAQKVLDP
jgi:hypothetical protein